MCQARGGCQQERVTVGLGRVAQKRKVKATIKLSLTFPHNSARLPLPVELLAAWGVASFHHLVYVGRTEVLARIAVLMHTSFIADVDVVNDQVRRLVLFVLRRGVIDVGQLVEGELPVALCRTNNVRRGAAISRKIRQILHPLVTCMVAVVSAQPAAAANLLNPGVKHS